MIDLLTLPSKALPRLALATILSLLPVSFGNGVEAAERVSVRYGPLQRSISVASLEAFAKDGSTDSTLRAFLRRVGPETQEGLRTALSATREVSPAELSRLLHTPTGDAMLQYTGQVIRTSADQNGAVGIRGALVVGATQPEGLSLLSFLKAFPTQEVRLDLGLAVAQFRQATRAIEEVDAFLAQVQQLSEQESAGSAFDYGSLPDIRGQGPYSVSSQTVMLEDVSRDRSYPADIYYPQDLGQIEGSIPVVVLSHGLGSSRVLFGDFAEHIASYGILVALPEHIGSNKERQDRVRKWLDDELFDPSEFVDRPQDVSFLLDELERLNDAEFQGRLDTTKVGVIGHSFGGYTALALAGGTVDFDRVQRLCRLDAGIDVGLVLLLTCRSLALQSSPEAVQLLTSGELQDDRVALVIAFNPVSNLFGETGMGRIQVPVVIAGGTDDIATPILREQAEPFTWLTTQEKYLIATERLSHNAALTTVINRAFYAVDESDENVEMTRVETRTTVAALLLAFSQVYVAGNEAFRPFLNSAYLKESNQQGFPLHMTRFLPPDSVPQTLN